MKCSFEIPFNTAKSAKDALKVLTETESVLSDRSSAKFTLKGTSVLIDVSASDFTALRAKCTTLLRDLKVIIDTNDILQEETE